MTLSSAPVSSCEPSTLTLANCAEVCAGVMRNISGRAVSDSINGSRLTRDNIAQMAMARISDNLVTRHQRARIDLKM